MSSSKRKSQFITKEVKASLIGAFMLIWLFFGAFVTGQLEIKPTRLILQQNGCALMERYQVTIHRFPDGSNCEVILPFRPAFIGAGGRVTVGSNEFTLPEGQITGYTVLRNQPFSPYQLRLIYLFSGATALLLLLAFSDKLFTRNKE